MAMAMASLLNTPKEADFFLYCPMVAENEYQRQKHGIGMVYCYGCKVSSKLSKRKWR